jgi:hypothetical protein
MISKQQWVLEVSTQTHVKRIGKFTSRQEAIAAMNDRAKRDGETVEPGAFWENEIFYDVQFQMVNGEWEFAPHTYVVRELAS